jgi:hypothetical protein
MHGTPRPSFPALVLSPSILSLNFIQFHPHRRPPIPPTHFCLSPFLLLYEQEYEPGTADTAETQLTIKQDVSLVGAEGAMLRGMLILDSPRGSIRNLKVCFTICLFISPDLDGYMAPKGINPIRPTRSRNPNTKPPHYVLTKV